MFRLHFSWSEYIETKAPPILDQIPTITITDGTASTEENRPYLIVNPDDQKLLAVIDTTGQYSSLEQAQARILVTKHEVMAQRNQYESRTFSFRELGSLYIDRPRINSFLRSIQKYFAVGLYPFALIYYFGYRIIQVLIYALIGSIIARILQPKLSYSRMIRLASVAITPALFVEAIFHLIGISFPPAWSLIGLLVVLCYLYFAVKGFSKSNFT